MIRVLIFILSLGFSISAAANMNNCLNLFSFSNSSDKFIYTAIDNSQKVISLNAQNKNADLIIGQAFLVGKEEGQLARPVATLDYTIKGDFLTISAARIPSDFTGEGVYRQLLAEVLADNPGVRTIMTSLTGTYYEEYLVNLAFAQNKMESLILNGTDSDAAIGLSSVFTELSKLGFTQLRSATVLENASGPFVRFSVTR